MQPDSDQTPPPAPRRRDAAGLALSAVTIAVLIVGVFVIRGVTEPDADPVSSGALSALPGEGLTPDAPVDPPTRPEQPIVVHPIDDEPTPLPPPQVEEPIGRATSRLGSAPASDLR